MEEIMMDSVGIFRNGKDLEDAVEKLQALLIRSRRISIRSRVKSANPELQLAYRIPMMLKLALCVAHGALQRTESRGAHFREDHLERNDRDWLNRTIAVWRREEDTLPTLSYEPIDVMTMELPPGSRGYGSAQIIEHPDTSTRRAQIEAIKADMPGADRFALQTALMPYEHLLPPRLRRRNERLSERFTEAPA